VTEKSYQLLILFFALESTAGTGVVRALGWIYPQEDAIWEPVDNFQEDYPKFGLEDKLKAGRSSGDVDTFVGGNLIRFLFCFLNSIILFSL